MRKGNILKYGVYIIILFFNISFCFAEGKSDRIDELNDAKNIANQIKEYVYKNFPVTDYFPELVKITSRIKNVINSIDNTEIKKIYLLKDISFYHNLNINDVLNYISSREGTQERFYIWKNDTIQEMLNQESSIRESMNIPEHILYISQKNERVIDEDIYRATYSSGDIVTIYKQGLGYITVGEVTFERKIPFTEIMQDGAEKFLLYSSSFFIKEGSYNTYSYNTYYTIHSNYGIYESDINNGGFTYLDAVFLRLGDIKNNVTFQPKQTQLFPLSYLPSPTKQQEYFINMSVIDVLRIEKDYSQTFKNIINVAKEITKGKQNDEEKILAIYDWMVQNISYPVNYKISDDTIYSGLEAFKNKSAVCEGQALLMYYLLKLSGIQNVEYIDGFQIDAGDFPEVRHAWIQIGEYFYDPSFEYLYQEDPSKYLYYKIPYDIFYTNKFNTYDLPEDFYKKTQEVMNDWVEEQRYLLTDKYTAFNNYMVLKKSFFKKEYGILPTKSISLGDLISFLPEYTLTVTDGKVDTNASTYPNNVDFYPIVNLGENIEGILYENNFNISKFVIIKKYQDGVFVSYGLSDSFQ